MTRDYVASLSHTDFAPREGCVAHVYTRGGEHFAVEAGPSEWCGKTEDVQTGYRWQNTPPIGWHRVRMFTGEEERRYPRHLSKAAYGLLCDFVAGKAK